MGNSTSSHKKDKLPQRQVRSSSIRKISDDDDSDDDMVIPFLPPPPPSSSATQQPKPPDNDLETSSNPIHEEVEIQQSSPNTLQKSTTLRRKPSTHRLREISSDSEYSAIIESWEPTPEDIYTPLSILYHIGSLCIQPWKLLRSHTLRAHTETNTKILGPELSKIDNALQPISTTTSLLTILYSRLRSRYTIVKYFERAGIIPKRKIDVDTQQPIYKYKRVYFAYISFFFGILNIFISILSLLCNCINFFPYTNGRTEFIHIFIAGAVQFIALILSTYITLQRLHNIGTCCELDIYMMYRSVRPTLIMFTLSVIIVIVGLILDIILLNLFSNLTTLYKIEFFFYSMFYVGMQYYISAYLAIALFFVLVDAKVCSALIESLGFHIERNTITWDVYLQLRDQIDLRIKAAQLQNMMMVGVAYINIADIIISFAQDPKAIGIETMCYFSRELFFLLFVYFEISKINEKADGLLSKVLTSPLQGDLYHKILNHVEKDGISYTIFGWRPKKFNVIYQTITIVVLPVVLRVLLTYYPMLAVLFTA